MEAIYRTFNSTSKTLMEKITTAEAKLFLSFLESEEAWLGCGLSVPSQRATVTVFGSFVDTQRETGIRSLSLPTRGHVFPALSK